MASLCHTNSRFHKTVDLHEWWLIWCETEDNEKKLAIAGYTSRCPRALRVFSSAPILRRHDVFTLETTDGIYVRIIGLVNKTRTEQNGFPSQVFKCFFFDFPPHWELCARHFLAQGFASNGVSGEDAFKGSSQTIEESNTTNVGAYVSPVSADPKLDKDQALCPIKEGLQSVNINQTGGAKNPGWKKTAGIEKEINLKENADIEDASKSGKKTQNNVSSENASFKGCSNANAHINERTDVRANVSLSTMDPELETIVEGSKNSCEAVQFFTRASAANDTDQRKTTDIEQESNLKENAVIKEASVVEEKTYSNVPSEDARLNGCSNASEQSNEMNNTNANVSLASTNPELDQDPTACPILEGLQNFDEAVRYTTRDCGAKDTDQRRTADIEMESNLKENAVIKEASIAEEKTCNNAYTEDASLEGCNSTASEQINEMTSTEANVSTANLELELDQDHTACMNLEGLKNSNEAVRIITRAHGVKDTDQRKTQAVEKESIMNENTASKEASMTGKNTCTDASRRFKESSKKSQKAVRCRTRSGGARNTYRRRTATVKKENTEKAASKETSTPVTNIKRKLTYESPMTPKADVKASFISPELSSVKRSRSGRLLLPTLEFWRNQTAVYDPDHQVIGITDKISMPSKAELTHEPKRSEGRAQSKKDPNAATGKFKNESKKPVGMPRSKINRAK